MTPFILASPSWYATGSSLMAAFAFALTPSAQSAAAIIVRMKVPF
jgi:hypothetical protein